MHANSRWRDVDIDNDNASVGVAMLVIVVWCGVVWCVYDDCGRGAGECYMMPLNLTACWGTLKREQLKR